MKLWGWENIGTFISGVLEEGVSTWGLLVLGTPFFPWDRPDQCSKSRLFCSHFFWTYCLIWLACRCPYCSNSFQDRSWSCSRQKVSFINEDRPGWQADMSPCTCSSDGSFGGVPGWACWRRNLPWWSCWRRNHTYPRCP